MSDSLTPKLVALDLPGAAVLLGSISNHRLLSSNKHCLMKRDPAETLFVIDSREKSTHLYIFKGAIFIKKQRDETPVFFILPRIP